MAKMIRLVGLPILSIFLLSVSSVKADRNLGEKMLIEKKDSRLLAHKIIFETIFRKLVEKNLLLWELQGAAGEKAKSELVVKLRMTNSDTNIDTKSNTITNTNSDTKTNTRSGMTNSVRTETDSISKVLKKEKQLLDEAGTKEEQLLKIGRGQSWTKLPWLGGRGVRIM